MSLEMNIVVFLPLISASTGGFQIENRIKYYLIQRIGSLWFLFRLIIFQKGIIISLLIFLTMLLKLGLAPFHLWFFRIILSSSWKIIFILSTIQKFIPLIVIRHVAVNKFYFISILILSLIVVLFRGIPLLSPRKIIALSSLNNVSWILLSSILNSNVWILYWIIYAILLSPIIYIFDRVSSQIKIQFIINRIRINTKFYLVFGFLSLRGLPPLLGFFNKILLIKILLKDLRIFILFVIIISSLVLIFYYLNIIYIVTCFSSPNILKKSELNTSFLKFNLSISLIIIMYIFSIHI